MQLAICLTKLSISHHVLIIKITIKSRSGIINPNDTMKLIFMNDIYIYIKQITSASEWLQHSTATSAASASTSEQFPKFFAQVRDCEGPQPLVFECTLCTQTCWLYANISMKTVNISLHANCEDSLRVIWMNRHCALETLFWGDKGWSTSVVGIPSGIMYQKRA